MIEGRHSRFPSQIATTVASLATAIAVALALAAIAGWSFNITLLRALRPGWPPMSLTMAVALLLCSLQVILLQRAPAAVVKHKLLWAPALAASLAGALTIALYSVVAAVGFDHAPTAGGLLASLWDPAVRMSLPSALFSLLGGLALFMLAQGGRRRADVAHALMLAAVTASYFVLIGYALGIKGIGTFLGVQASLNSCLAFSALGVAVFCVRTDTWFSSIFAGDLGGSLMARRLLPAIVIIPLLIGYVRLYGERAGRFESEVGVALVALAYTLCLLGLVALTAVSLNRTDRQRRRAEATLREAHDGLETRVRERTSELQQASRSLEVERQRFSEVLNMLPAYVILLTPDYHVAFANRFFEERFGSSVGRRCFEYLFGLSGPCENCETYKTLTKKGPHRWEWTGPDGRNYDIYDFPFTDTDGSPLVLEMGLDITERKQYEAELRHHRDHLEEMVAERTTEIGRRNAELAAEIAERKQTGKALLESRQRLQQAQELLEAVTTGTEVIIATVDRDLRYTFFNKPYEEEIERLAGKRVAIGASMLEIFADQPEQQAIAVEAWTRTLQGQASTRTVTFGDPGRYQRVYRVHHTPILDTAGQVIGAGEVAYDVTEQMRAEEILRRDKDTLERLVADRSRQLVDAQLALERSRRLSDIGMLSATVAHELRNPLAAIKLAAFNIKRKVHGDSLVNHVRTIEAKILESDQIINNLLFFSRIRIPNLETVDVADLLGECLDAAAKLSGRKASIKRTLDPIKGISIEADRLQLREVFQNILNNAYDALPDEGGRIEVAAADRGESLELRFRDNGKGIEAEDLKRVCDPFFSTKAKGTGLGLTVCSQIIEMHGGVIGITSDPGKGTEVTLEIPKRGAGSRLQVPKSGASPAV